MLRFVSDLHLCAETPALLAAFEKLLEVHAADDELYILGDLLDAWPGDDEQDDWALTLRRALRAASKKGPIRLLHGNRDFMLGARFAEDSGIEVLTADHVEINLGDERAVLLHGDTLCTDDEAYQQQRPHLRDRNWQSELLSRSLGERRALAKALRGSSEAHKANLPSAIMDANVDAIEALFRACGARVMIHGHTHRPGIHDHAGGRRYVLGDWRRCGWLLTYDGHEFRLGCIPLPSEPH